MATKSKKPDKAEKANNFVIATNRKARHNYSILETFEAGVVLSGWEIKAIRAGQVQLTDGYGPRNGPAGTSGFHGGQDFTPGEGTPIGSIADGVVKRVDLTGASSFGIFIEVEHVIEGQRVTSLYAHMMYGSRRVTVGQTVSAGQLIGQVSDTGRAYGTHLHLEIYVNGSWVNSESWLVANAG